jgi:hypothetical protein
MANPALETRHWEQIFSAVEQKFNASQPVTVAGLLSVGVLEKLKEVQAIAATASKEFSMLKMLEKMEKVCATSCALRLASSQLFIEAASMT